MIILCAEILIGGILFDFVEECTIEAGWNDFTQTAEIRLPRKLSFEGKEITLGTSGLIKRGQEVEIKAGYDYRLETYFKGFVSDVVPDVNITIMCQDLMYNLKQNTLNVSTDNTTLSGLLAKVVPSSVNYSATLDGDIGKFRISNASTLDVLKRLKSGSNGFGFQSFVINETLYVGAPYVPNSPFKKTIDIDFQKDVIESDMVFKNADDIKIKVKAISVNDANERLEIEVGDKDGASRTMYFYDVKSVSRLKELAQNELDKIKINGFTGSFTTFLQPRIQHGDSINLIDNEVKDRNGSYLVKSVKTTFGVNGGRQEVELDGR